MNSFFLNNLIILQNLKCFSNIFFIIIFYSGDTAESLKHIQKNCNSL